VIDYGVLPALVIIGFLSACLFTLALWGIIEIEMEDTRHWKDKENR